MHVKARKGLRLLSAVAALSLLGLMAQDARAQVPDKPSHEGLLLRLTIGAGGSVTNDSTSPVIELSGATGFFSFDIGGSIAQRLAIHARLSTNTLVDPNVTIGGDDLGEVERTSLTFGFLGVGLTPAPSAATASR